MSVTFRIIEQPQEHEEVVLDGGVVGDVIAREWPLGKYTGLGLLGCLRELIDRAEYRSDMPALMALFDLGLAALEENAQIELT